MYFFNLNLQRFNVQLLQLDISGYYCRQIILLTCLHVLDVLDVLHVLDVLDVLHVLDVLDVLHGLDVLDVLHGLHVLDVLDGLDVKLIITRCYYINYTESSLL